MEFKKQTNAIYYCDYHLVITTKYRKKVINQGLFEYFKIKLKEIRKYYPYLEIKECNHNQDHIHILISIPPKVSVGSVVRIIKSNTANKLKSKFDFLKQAYWGTESIWSKGYFVSTVGINQRIIENYIKNQTKEDSGQAKLDLG